MRASVAGLIKGRKFVESSEQKQALYFSSRSKAVMVHGPGKASFEDIETPRPRPSEVLIRVAYEGVCGTDLEIYEGRLGYFEKGLAEYPIIPGHEFSGWITKLGANVKNLREGDPVVVECIQGCGSCEPCRSGNQIACHHRKEMGVMGLNGGYAEYVVAPARFVHRIPDNIDMRQAVLCEPLAVVRKGIEKLEPFVNKANTKQDATYAVIGAGPIGYLSAQVLACRGKEVVVYDKHPKRLSYYADTSIRTETDISNVCDRFVFVEATGDPDVLHRLLEASPAGATFLLLGLPYSRREFNFESLVAFDKTVIGSVGSNSEDFSAALKLLPRLKTEALLKNVIKLSQYKHAWESFKEREFLKTILEVNGTNT